MENYKDLLTFKQPKDESCKNTIKVWVEWDSNDADYIEKTEWISPEELFGNKKLILCLAYAWLDPDWKGRIRQNDPRFCRHVPDNEDIDGLDRILSYNGFMAHTDWGPCHSLTGMKITYYDEDGTPWDVDFDDIYTRWETMSYKEICDEINNAQEPIAD